MPGDPKPDNLPDHLMDSNTLVSIVIPTFNRKRFVCEAIESEDRV